jgi:2'-5' RNA ligase
VSRLLRRGFVELVPPAEVLDHVEMAVVPLREEFPRLRWTPRAQWHLTLQFLGPVPDVDALVEAVHAGVSGIAPFTVRLGGGGAFAKSSSATVLWFGAAEGGDATGTLGGAVSDATAALGCVADERPFRAHLTLARAARPTDLRGAIAALDAAGPSPEWTASEVVLFESDTRPDGAVHTVIARVPLADQGS